MKMYHIDGTGLNLELRPNMKLLAEFCVQVEDRTRDIPRKGCEIQFDSEPPDWEKWLPISFHFSLLSNLPLKTEEIQIK